jgi:uncharacterized delta-60 repeat protein
MRARNLPPVLVVVCVAMFSGSALAAPGDRDRTFGDGGLAKIEPYDGSDSTSLVAMVVGPRDEILVLLRDVGSGLRVIRFHPNGSLDRSFGEDGSSPRMYAEREGALAVGPDGEVVVASEQAQGTIGLTRLTSAGDLDRNFGTGGDLVADVGGYGDGPLVVVQPDREVVLVAQRYDNFPYTSEGDLVVNRYTVNGMPDTGFGIGGTAEFRGSSAQPGSVALLSDGGMAVGTPCCYYDGYTPDAFFVGRLTSSGIPAPSGLQGVKVDSKWATVGSILPLPEGGIEVLGMDFEGYFAAELLPDGRLSPRFGSGGVSRLRQVHFERLAMDGVGGAMIDARGKMVGAAQVRHIHDGEYGKHLALFRILANGRPDPTFAAGGEARFTLGDLTSVIDAGMQSSGRIVVALEGDDCGRYCTVRSMSLVRYFGGVSHTRCLGRRATIVGTRRAETLTGTPGRDVIAALGGGDTVRGLGGDDLICGGPGRDHIFGGAGRDRVRQ